MIPPIPPNVAAAGLKSAGSITSAAIGRYRPAGVPRTGSSEDRAGAYGRLLDASTRAFNYQYMFRDVRVTGGRGANRLLMSQFPEMWNVSSELLAALHGVRLRGTLPVIAAAETLVRAITRLDMNEDANDTFRALADTVVTTQNAFLDAARTDLAYDTRPWQLLRRRRERKFLKGQQREALEVPGQRSVEP